ncbi:MAG: carbohydrate ABC transporter permease [Oscillospiraceae bacterium]|nr:carbohydrate ABC transporter permease [Oscillospiraceae bacterium]
MRNRFKNLTDDEKRYIEQQKAAAKSVKKKWAFRRIMTALQSDMSNSKKLMVIAKILFIKLRVVPKYFILIALSIIFIAPFFYMIGHSLMGTQDILNPSIRWLPRSFNFANYIYAYQALDYQRYLIRTLWIVGLSVAGQMFFCSFVAYGIARIKFKLRGVIFALILFILIVPPQTLVVPNYMLYSDVLEWRNSFLPIIVPCFFAMGLNGGLIIFVFRQFYKGLPAELENAALIDGVSVFGAYFRVIIPNAMPAVLINSILCLVWHWNNSFEPSIYIRDVTLGTLTMQLREVQNRLSSAFDGIDFNAGIKMAATMLVLLPIVVIFLALQGRFMKNMASTGLAN